MKINYSISTQYVTMELLLRLDQSVMFNERPRPISGAFQTSLTA